MTYQIDVLKEFEKRSDQLKHVVPCHGELTANELKQLLNYYLITWDTAKKLYLPGSNYETFKSGCSAEKILSHLELFKNMTDEEKERHNKNIEWLWDYFNNSGIKK